MNGLSWTKFIFTHFPDNGDFYMYRLSMSMDVVFWTFSAKNAHDSISYDYILMQYHFEGVSGIKVSLKEPGKGKWGAITIKAECIS